MNSLNVFRLEEIIVIYLMLTLKTQSRHNTYFVATGGTGGYVTIDNRVGIMTTFSLGLLIRGATLVTTKLASRWYDVGFQLIRRRCLETTSITLLVSDLVTSSGELHPQAGLKPIMSSYSDVTWASYRVNSLATRLFFQCLNQETPRLAL